MLFCIQLKSFKDVGPAPEFIMKDKPLNIKTDSLNQSQASELTESNELPVEQAQNVKSSVEKVTSDVADNEKSVQKELNGPKGLEPTRYGDWESKGRCYDF